MLKVHSIFVHHKGSLYAAVFEEEQGGETLDELRKLIRLWTRDLEYLSVFFKKYERDLREHNKEDRPSKAAKTTRNEAKALFKKLMELAESNDYEEFSRLFKPLDNREEGKASYEHQSLKAYGFEYKSWLRIYAIKHGNTFVITGGAIKLTDTMKERPHTKLELHKLELVKKYLETGDVEFVYLEK